MVRDDRRDRQSTNREREQNTDEDVERERGRRIRGTIRSCRSDESEREECKC